MGLAATLSHEPFNMFHKCSLDAEKLQRAGRKRAEAAIASAFVSQTGIHLILVKHYGRGLFRLFVCLILAVLAFTQAIFHLLPLPVFFGFFVVEVFAVCIMSGRASIERWTLTALVDPENTKELSERMSVMAKKHGTKKADILIALVFIAFVIGIVFFVYSTYKF